MMTQLGVLEEEGGLKNFTALAEAVIRFDETLKHVENRKAITRLGRMLDHVFSQAYRGEKSMSFLADRVESVLEMLEGKEHDDATTTVSA